MNDELIMPFFEDAPEYAIGFESGMLWQRMLNGEIIVGQMIHNTNRAQIELICLHHGAEYEINKLNPDWCSLTVSGYNPTDDQ